MAGSRREPTGEEREAFPRLDRSAVEHLQAGGYRLNLSYAWRHPAGRVPGERDRMALRLLVECYGFGDATGSTHS